MAFITQIHKSRNDRGHLRPSGRGMGSGNGEGGCTNGKVARFIFNGFQWLKPTSSNRHHCPLSTLALRQRPPNCIISRKTKLTRRNKTNTAHSQNVSPGKNGSFNIRQLPDWTKVTGPELVWPLDRGLVAAHQKRLRWDTQNIYRKGAWHWALQAGGRAEGQNLHCRGAWSIESTKEVSACRPSLERGLLLWSTFDWGHHTDIKQFSDK